MTAWTFYPVFLGTVVSVLGLCRLVIKGYDASSPKTLSELAAAEETSLKRFRHILLFCDALFAITLFGFITPRFGQNILVITFGLLMIGGELFVSLVPARGKTSLVHLLLAQVMAIGMLGLVVSFWVMLSGIFSEFEAILTVCMAASALLTIADKKHYLVYELAFIFSSHTSIVITAVALK